MVGLPPFTMTSLSPKCTHNGLSVSFYKVIQLNSLVRRHINEDRNVNNFQLRDFLTYFVKTNMFPADFQSTVSNKCVSCFKEDSGEVAIITGFRWLEAYWCCGHFGITWGIVLCRDESCYWWSRIWPWGLQAVRRTTIAPPSNNTQTQARALAGQNKLIASSSGYCVISKPPSPFNKGSKNVSINCFHFNWPACTFQACWGQELVWGDASCQKN